MFKYKNCGETFECDKPLRDGDVLCPACAGECADDPTEALTDDGVVLINGAMSFEVEAICKRLDSANIRFSLQPMSTNESGIINVRPDNAAAGLTNIANAFSSSGLSTCYQIRVAAEDYEKAKELVEQSEETQTTESAPPPESAFTDPEPDPVGVVGPKGIWGWNTIPMLNVLAMVLLGAWGIWHEYTPIFFNGAATALSTPGNEAYNPPLLNLIIFETVGNFALVAFSLMVLIFLFRRNKRYPKLCTILFWSAVLFEGIDVSAAIFQGVKIAESSTRDLLRSFVFAVIWMKYFKSSVRIANTFTVGSSVKRPALMTFILWCLITAGFFSFRWYEAYKTTLPGPTKQYVCHLETEGNTYVSGHIGCVGGMSDEEYRKIKASLSKRLEDRLALCGCKNYSVDVRDKEDIVVTFSCPEESSIAIANSLVIRGELQFRLCHPRNDEMVVDLLMGDDAPIGFVKCENGYEKAKNFDTVVKTAGFLDRLHSFHVPRAGYEFLLEYPDKNGTFKPNFVAKKVELTGAEISRATAYKDDDGRVCISLTFTDDGAKIMEQLTKKYKAKGTLNSSDHGRVLAMVYDGSVLSAPIIQTVIGKYAEITGNFSESEAWSIVRTLNSGALPASLSFVSFDEIGEVK